MQVRERKDEADEVPAFRSVPAETDLLANTARPNIDPADLAVLLRDLRRLSEVCTRSHLDQAAALIEVAAPEFRDELRRWWKPSPVWPR